MKTIVDYVIEQNERLCGAASVNTMQSVEFALESFIKDRPWIATIEAAIEKKPMQVKNIHGEWRDEERPYAPLIYSADCYISGVIRIKPEVVCPPSRTLDVWNTAIAEEEGNECLDCGLPPSKGHKIECSLKDRGDATLDDLPWRPVTNQERKCLPMDSCYWVCPQYYPSKYRGKAAPAKSGLHFNRVGYFTRQPLPQPVKTEMKQVADRLIVTIPDLLCQFLNTLARRVDALEKPEGK